MSTRRTTRADVARALWLLGLEPPVDERELARAWRGRVARTHPDLHIESDRRAEAATLLTTALNDARRVVAEWIESGREWPAPDGGTVARPATGAAGAGDAGRARGLSPHRPAPRGSRPQLAVRRRAGRGAAHRGGGRRGRLGGVRGRRGGTRRAGSAGRLQLPRLRSVRRPRAGAVPDPAVPRLPRRSRAPGAAAGRGAAYSLSHRGAVGGRPGDRRRAWAPRISSSARSTGGAGRGGCGTRATRIFTRRCSARSAGRSSAGRPSLRGPTAARSGGDDSLAAFDDRLAGA